MIDRNNLALNRLVNRSSFETHLYRRFFRHSFWSYLEKNGFNPFEVSQMNETEVSAMWEMFKNDGGDNL